MVSMFSLEGKNAAVVGGASGIGEAVATAFAEHGASVLCLDVDIAGALDTAETITKMGGEADAGQLNILDGEAVTAAFESFNVKKGSLDIVVCTPGVNVRKPILEYTDEDIDRVLGVNLKGYDPSPGSSRLLKAVSSLVIGASECSYEPTCHARLMPEHIPLSDHRHHPEIEYRLGGLFEPSPPGDLQTHLTRSTVQ